MLDSSTHSADLLNQLPSPLDVASGSNFLPSDPLRSSLDLLSFSDRSSFTPNSFIQALSPLPINGFNSGYFTVGDTGQVGIDYLFDGGGYQGELAIFSLSGLEDFATDLSTLTNEVVHRALSETVLGHVVIRDEIEGARFNGELGEGNFNVGDHLGVKTFTMTAGDRFGMMLAPNGTIAALQNNPNPQGVDRPLFSLVGLNPEFGFQVGQMADVDGNGSTFVLEDLRVDGESDRDYNDMIFQVRGAIGSVVRLDEVIPFDNDWRKSTLGQSLLDYAAAYDQQFQIQNF